MESQVDHLTFSYTEIVESVRAHMRAFGLEKTMHCFASMEAVMSCLPWWHLVKRAVMAMFAEERAEERRWEQERIKANAPVHVGMYYTTEKTNIEQFNNRDGVVNDLSDGVFSVGTLPLQQVLRAKDFPMNHVGEGGDHGRH